MFLLLMFVLFIVIVVIVALVFTFIMLIEFDFGWDPRCSKRVACLGGNGVDDGADFFGSEILINDRLDVFFLVTDCLCGIGSNQFSEHIIAY